MLLQSPVIRAPKVEKLSLQPIRITITKAAHLDFEATV